MRRAAVAARAAAYLAVWAAFAVAATAVVFLNSSRQVVVASHEALLEPTMGGHVVLLTGPVLPDLRISSGHRIGVDVDLGKTDARSTDQLARRYAYLASQPQGQIAAVQRELGSMAHDAALRGAVLGLLPLLAWVLLGQARRRELVAQARGPRGALALGVVGLVALGLWQPWHPDTLSLEERRSWMSLGDFLGPEVSLPPEAARVQVRGDVTTVQTRRLIKSAVETYDKSKQFYADATTRAADLDLRPPAEGDTVVTLVSDRHDNIGMDTVARAIGDAAGATAVFDAGDDTSSGKTWEAFSLDSVTAAFDHLDRWGVAGNHDNGSFVHRYLEDRHWTMLDGRRVQGPGGISLIGVDDPRSSGLGSWRDQTGLRFDEVGRRLADAACDSDQRISTVLVHDIALAEQVLARGCADLVVGGHLHLQTGPRRVVGSNGRVGYAYRTGTAGGAAYAIAVGSKPRRDAEVSLLTYHDGRPVGIQPVVLRTDGQFEVGDYLELDLREGPAGTPPGDGTPANVAPSFGAH